METAQTKQGDNKKKGGRPVGYSPKQDPKGLILHDDGEYITVKIPKKQLGKLILKDLL
jgi:hypothetical protein